MFVWLLLLAISIGASAWWLGERRGWRLVQGFGFLLAGWSALSLLAFGRNPSARYEPLLWLIGCVAIAVLMGVLLVRSRVALEPEESKPEDHPGRDMVKVVALFTVAWFFVGGFIYFAAAFGSMDSFEPAANAFRMGFIEIWLFPLAIGAIVTVVGAIVLLVVGTRHRH